jgi:hypothetical protein
VPGRIIFNGESGERWENTTGKVRWQFHAALHNTCGVCLQYHMAVGPWWPLKIHRGCQCWQEAVAVGAYAEPFVDFRELLANMDPHNQAAAVGKSAYRLITEGVVGWKDVVAEWRVRTLEQVVAREKLTVKTMVSAGVKPRIAERAYKDVHTPEQELIRRQREAAVARLVGSGASVADVQKAVAAGIAARVRVVGGAERFAEMPTAPLAPHMAAVLFGLDEAAIAARIAAAGLGRAVPAPHVGEERPVTVPSTRGEVRGEAAVPPPVAPALTREPFRQQVAEAIERVPEVRLIGEKAWIHDVYAAHQADPLNPRLTLDQFKELLLEDETRAKLVLGRADMAHAMNQADVAASQTEYKIGDRTAATFNFIRPKKR